MNTALTVWLALTLLCGGLASIAVWSRVKTWMRPLAVVVFFLFLPIGAVATIACLGVPAPIVPILNPLPSGMVSLLGVKLVPNKAIYVLVDDGSMEPRLLHLPWNAEQAAAIQAAQEEAAKEGRPLRGKFGESAAGGKGSGKGGGKFDPDQPVDVPEVKVMPKFVPLTVPGASQYY